MSEKQEGIVPYTTAGFPNGAGSAKEAVNLEIQKAGENQTNANGILGGRRMTYKKKVRFSRKHRSRSTQKHRSRAHRSTSVSRKRRSTNVSRKRRSTSVSRKRRSTSVSRKHRSNARRSTIVSRKRRSKAHRSTSVSRTRKMYKGGLVDGEAIEVPQFGPSVGPLNPNSASVLTNSILLKAQQDSAYDKQISN